MVLESNTLDYIFLQDGENGVGTPGKDGKTLYTWVKYSQNADGSNMSDSPENALYIGIAYNKDSATESTNTNDYNWTKIKGEQGLPGADAYTIILSNESHTFSGTVTSAIASSTKCYIIAYKGTKQLSVTIGTISNLPEGMTAPISNNGTTNAYFSPTVTSSMTTKNGTLTIPITVDGKTFTKYFSYSLALQGNNGISATNIILSNESHTFSANASGQADATSINIDILGFTGTTQVRTQIGELSGLPTGMTMKINNNGTINTSITVSVTSSLTTSQGAVKIPITADGVTVEKSFSYALSKTGATGATGTAAKSIDITASSQVFKSTDGGNTFSPDTITLTPVFQGGISYSKWQYSVNGGSTWTDVTSGSHGLTISSGVLSIAKTSDLFTDTVTSISFKCISNNSTYYDIMTVLKLYDVTDIEIGGRNLVLQSNIDYSNSSYPTATYFISASEGEILSTGYGYLVPGKTYSYSIRAKSDTEGESCRLFASSGYVQLIEKKIKTEWDVYKGTFVMPNYYPGRTPSDEPGHAKVSVYKSSNTSTATVYIDWIKIEYGNKSTDWTPAPEDIQDQFTTVTNSIKGVANDVDQVNKKIIAKVWQNDITDSINNYDGSTVKIIRDRMTSTETDVSGIKTTLSDVQTTVSKKADGSTVQELTEHVAAFEASYNGFKTTVSETYTTKEDFNNLEIGGRNILSSTKNFTAGDDRGGESVRNGETYMGTDVRYLDTTSLDAGSFKEFFTWFRFNKLKASATYCVSFWAKGSGKIKLHLYGDSGYLKVAKILTSQGHTGTSVDGNIDINLSNSWTRYWVQYTMSSSDVSETIKNHLLFRQYGGNVVYIAGVKLELGNKATDWTPAPEDVEQSITSVSSQYTQLSNKFNWVVKSGTSSSDFTITDRMATLVSDYINLKGLVTFSGLDSTAQSKINTAQSTANSAVTKADTAQSTANTAKTNAATAQSTADSAKTAAANAQTTANSAKSWTDANGSNMTSLLSMVKKWTNNAVSDTTTINGGWISTNTITASQIASGAIITAKLATDAIKSTNYSYSSGNFSSAGTFLDLSTGLIRSKNFAIDSSGNAYFKGNIQANAGYIGGTSGWSITTNTITGNENSKIISGILESSNYVANSTGVQMNLNTGIIKGNIEATTLAAKDALQIYVGSTKRCVITGVMIGNYFHTFVGCNLEIGGGPKLPCITFDKTDTDKNGVIGLYARSITIGSASNLESINIETTNMNITGKLKATSATFDQQAKMQAIELSFTTPFIDFHFDNSSADFTSRIITPAEGVLDIDQCGQWGHIRIDSQSGWLFPLTNGGYSLGNASYRFCKLWLTESVDSSSLFELKTQISPFASALEEIENTDVFNYKMKEAIKRKGDDIVHTGFVIGGGYNCSDYLISESREGIDLYSAIGVTFGGVKELYEIVKQQQKTIEELKERLNK